MIQRNDIICMRDDGMRPNLFSICQYGGKIRKLSVRKLNFIFMRIVIGNRVLTEVRGESKRVRALAAGKRVVGASARECAADPGASEGLPEGRNRLETEHAGLNGGNAIGDEARVGGKSVLLRAARVRKHHHGGGAIETRRVAGGDGLPERGSLCRGDHETTQRDAAALPNKLQIKKLAETLKLGGLGDDLRFAQSIRQDVRLFIEAKRLLNKAKLTRNNRQALPAHGARGEG
jgi:hypothetical protein